MLAILLTLIAVPALLVTAQRSPGQPGLTALIVYSASLATIFAASALFHHGPHDRWRRMLLRLDHSAIYFKIAGTHGALVAISGIGAGHVAVGFWLATGTGAAFRVFGPEHLRRTNLAIYLGIGIGGFVLARSALATLSQAAHDLVLLGGLLYLVGVPFFVWDQELRFGRAIWHAFVLAATATIYGAIMVELAGMPPPAFVEDAGTQAIL